MKLWLKLSLILFSASNYAGMGKYYSQVSNQSGYELKRKLQKVLERTHEDQGYRALYYIYFESDIDQTYDNDGTILDMYSENPHHKDPYNFSTTKHMCGQYRQESDCFNREHLFPQGIFHKRSPMRSDFFHIFPSDGKVNNRRGNSPFGEVRKPDWVSRNGSKVGTNTTPGYSGTVFEPIDEFKGDIARALFYFATRYGNKIPSWKSHDMLDGSTDQVYRTWFLKVLIKWHKQDPVSKHERYRNEVGHRFQGNRNPFIDHPEWVSKIWE